MRPIFASPAAALLVGLSVLLPGLSIPASADAATVKGAVSKSVKHAVKSAEIPAHCPARFITALLIGPRGGVWAAGEDTGIYHRKAGGHSWKHFDKSNSPGLISNSIYSLCIDDRGRLWAGTNRHGVCVYNGRKWRHYGLLAGPLGSHVVAISSDPRDGSVFICSENGLSIYMPRGNGTKPFLARLPHSIALAATPLVLGRWRYISRLNGLPANPDCVAFNKKGTAFVGTLCGGLAVAAYPYTHWRVIHGPLHLSISATGAGLPSNLINCVLVGRHGRIYVGTDRGLAISTDGGQSFRYERGMNYAAKVLGLWHPPAGFTAPPRAFLNNLLPGDHITCLAQGIHSNVWLGTWRNGYAKIDTRTGKIIQSQFIKGLSQLDGYISSLAFAANGSLLVGRYGFGVSALKRPRSTANLAPRPQPRGSHIVWPLSGQPMPQSAKPPTHSQLQRFTDELGQAKGPPPFAAYLGADWQTQGNWLGRYGKYWACLCAMCSPEDYWWGAGRLRVSYSGHIGPHHRKGDAVRYWVQWLQTNNPNSLEMPPVYYSSRIMQGYASPGGGSRREAEADDHGETYPYTWQGPGLRWRIKVPTGKFQLSVYDFNKDGHYGANRFRDYLIGIHRVASLESPITGPAVVRARIVSFCAGVYERFIIRGPGCYVVQISRNYSLNTILCGVMLDRMEEHPAPYYPGPHWPGLRKQRSNTKLRHEGAMKALENQRFLTSAGGIVGDYVLAMLLARRITATGYDDGLEGEPQKLVERHLARAWYFADQFRRWEALERKLGLAPPRAIEKSLRWHRGEFDCRGSGHNLIEEQVQKLRVNSGFGSGHVAGALDAGIK